MLRTVQSAWAELKAQAPLLRDPSKYTGFFRVLQGDKGYDVYSVSGSLLGSCQKDQKYRGMS